MLYNLGTMKACVMRVAYRIRVLSAKGGASTSLPLSFPMKFITYKHILEGLDVFRVNTPADACRVDEGA
jgi:hypothetical protein